MNDHHHTVILAELLTPGRPAPIILRYLNHRNNRRVQYGDSARVKLSQLSFSQPFSNNFNGTNVVYA